MMEENEKPIRWHWGPKVISSSRELLLPSSRDRGSGSAWIQEQKLELWRSVLRIWSHKRKSVACPRYQLEKKKRNTLAVFFLLLSSFPPCLLMSETSKRISRTGEPWNQKKTFGGQTPATKTGVEQFEDWIQEATAIGPGQSSSLA